VVAHSEEIVRRVIGMEVAQEVLALINAQPRTPAANEIAEVVFEALRRRDVKCYTKREHPG
jgi:hypothetical protein